MKLLFVTRKWPPAVGGMELYSRELTEALAGHAEVEVLALPGRPDGSPPSALALAGFLVRAAAGLAVRARCHDVVHFGDFVLFPLAVWTRMVAPGTLRVVSVHGLDLIYGRRRGWKPALYRGFVAVAWLLRGAADRFVANSRATARVARDMGFGPVIAVPLGIKLPQDEGEAPATPAGGREVLFVGRIVPRKGLAWFAESVLPLLPEDVTLKIAGTVWDRDELSRALENPRAQYLGRLDDRALAQARRRAAATVMPNRSHGAGDMEGFGLAALEAAAHGSVLAASGIEGIVDAVDDGRTGFLLPEGCAQRWAETLNEVLAWPEARRAAWLAEARRILARDYSWDRVARQTIAEAYRGEGR